MLVITASNPQDFQPLWSSWKPFTVVLKIRLPIQVYFLAVFLVLTMNGARADNSTKSCAKPYDKMMVCNLMCNLLQDSDANDAIKMLQAKLESLIAVVNKPSPTLPPGKSFNFSVFSPVFPFEIFNRYSCLLLLKHISGSSRWSREWEHIARVHTTVPSLASFVSRASINKEADGSSMYSF